MTTAQVISGIKSNNKNTANKTFNYIRQEYYPMIKYLVTTNNCSDDDAEDVFQDGMVALLEKVNLKLTCSFKTYLYLICRRKLIALLATRKKVVLWDIGEYDVNDLTEERFSLYLKHFDTLHESCKDILTMFFHKVPMKEMAKIRYTTPEYIKKAKFMCKERLIKRIQNDPNFKKLI